ncbi:DUF1294 domain-containing protein [Rossellomorea aquimaris]|uniref:DUF1294 domain-containing protein n=1 Tax=Rossellomorea aquimaris TaxID=189382 RepID=UPI001CD39FA7|nr:DUF1294 domain-containing protein [Rossellomorea aquimaris]MCA1056397.1 DUF1294 domain-containing protein [Rossellomorea aquimaris]
MESLLNLLYIYILIINIIGFSLMRNDKKKAQRHEFRIKEKTLWTVAIIGGSYGSYVAMKVYRHKTKHKSFSMGFPLLVILHSILFIWVNQGI